MKNFIKIIANISIIFLILVCVFSIVRPTYDKNDVIIKKADAILILGFSLEDGYVPSPWLVSRLEEGKRLYDMGYAPKIIVSGSKGRRDNIPVSVAMANWLMSNGVPEDDIIIEDMATNTYENFKYSKELAEQNNINSIIVVTNDFHMERALLISSEFFDEAYGAPAYTEESVEKFLFTVREYFSFMKYYILDRSYGTKSNKTGN